ncbi:DoxX-like protein [Actinocorallia herbida]|uniref:DoxX-like protein n=1 Tax=Actinocorallia herbida TaxID=58109 RepID=A0A3N1D3A7_9ACTN|nr:DoxX family protein [Actinocorallia herbida]ROO87976.1 DoxX-like protein [Actinocorallia herbida]
MNVTLWIVQGILAAMFGMAGVMKSTQPREKLVGSLPWVEDFSTPIVRLIGVVEFAAALGLVLPAATGIVPILTPLAASGLVVVMVGAIITHVRRKEPQAIVFNAVLLVAAAFVAWGRFGPHSL